MLCEALALPPSSVLNMAGPFISSSICPYCPQSLIPDIRQSLGQEAVVDLDPEQAVLSGPEDEEKERADQDLQIQRTVTQVCPQLFNVFMTSGVPKPFRLASYFTIDQVTVIVLGTPVLHEQDVGIKYKVRRHGAPSCVATRLDHRFI